MPKPVCVPCGLFYRPERNGVAFEERMPRQREDGSEEWVPYKLWMSDRWKCRGCGAEILVTGAAQGPIAEHYQPDYPRERERFAPTVLVNDC